MEYEGQICRSPMERSAFMLPVAVGCYYNACKFCTLFKHLKYRELPLEQIEAEAGKALEYAFDFMEDAFGKGEEMVVFVTELSVNKAAVGFLAEHECKRYLTYNMELMIGSRKSEIMSELKR